MRRASLSAVFTSLLLLLGVADSSAYSYAASGVEPLIDGREAVLGALDAADFEAAREAAKALAEPIAYLDEHFGLALAAELDAAFGAADASRVSRVLNRALAAEVERRLAGAAANIAAYQRAKVLVVKSKVFLDLLAPALAAEPRAVVNEAIRECLRAIGNPGVFGAGSRPADPEALARATARIERSLETLE